MKKIKINLYNFYMTKKYTAHPHDMVHKPAKYSENTPMRFVL